MMHDREKSDPAIVAEKPTNKAGQPAAELVEPRAGAESFYSPEGNMCGTAKRGAVALPGSKATSRAKGSHRKLGGLVSGRVVCVWRSASGR